MHDETVPVLSFYKRLKVHATVTKPYIMGKVYNINPNDPEATKRVIDQANKDIKEAEEKRLKTDPIYQTEVKEKCLFYFHMSWQALTNIFERGDFGSIAEQLHVGMVEDSAKNLRAVPGGEEAADEIGKVIAEYKVVSEANKKTKNRRA